MEGGEYFCMFWMSRSIVKWDWQVDDIVDEFGSFKLIVFSNGSLVLTMDNRESS